MAAARPATGHEELLTLIDLDQLEDRLDLALEEDLRRHLGLDRQAPSPESTWNVSPPPSPPAPAPSPATPSPRVDSRPTRARPGDSSPGKEPPPAKAPPPVRPLRVRQRRRTGTVLKAVVPSSADSEGASAGGRSSSHARLEAHGRRLVELVLLGRIEEADAEILAHARLAETLGDPLPQRDAAAWAVMRALCEGRHQDARDTGDPVLSLGEAGGDPGASSLHGWQRFWLISACGSESEKNELLDFCRQRAYWHDQLDWRAGLALLLAQMGYPEDASRELDTVLSSLNGLPRDGVWLDIVTNLAETAAVLGDAARARTVYDLLAPYGGRTVLVGRAWVCKGSTSQQLARLAMTLGRHAEADRHFRVAAAAHRELGLAVHAAA